jgi:hypothetical protein
VANNGRDTGYGLLSYIALFKETEGMDPRSLKSLGGMNERLGVVDADDFGHMSGEFEGGTSHGASQIQGSPRAHMGLGKKKPGTGSGKVFDPFRNRSPLGKKFVRLEVVKGEIFPQNGGFFVRRGFQARSFSR